VTAALHEAAHCAPSLTVQVDVGSPKSSFSSTDLPELLQDTDSDRGHWEETGHLHTRSPHHGQGVTLPLTCPPSANARDSRDLHPQGLAPREGWRPASEAPGPPPPGNQLLPEGENQGAALLLRHTPWGTSTWGRRGGVPGQGLGARLAAVGERWAPGLQGWPRHAAAGWGLRGLHKPSVARTRDGSEQEQAASRGPGPGPHRP